MIKVSLIGCGNIGTELACFIAKDKRFALKYVVDVNQENVANLLSKIKSRAKGASMEKAIAASDLIIEAANKDVVKELLHCKEIDRKGKMLLVMSTGGLTENFSALQKLKHLEVYVPAGAIAGIDAIKACAGKIDSLQLRTTKPAYSLQGSPYMKKHKVNMEAITGNEKIFDGRLKEAVKGFPQNINVAASLFLATHFPKIQVQIFADPQTKVNTHEIVCEGSFGTIRTVTENKPSSNPKTSYLAILSAESVLDSLAGKIKIGS
jgi:aspartate dehydrogenase